MADSIFITNGSGTITGLTASGEALTEIVIPSEIDGVPITTIGFGAFSLGNLGNPQYKSVTIPASVTLIEGYAFNQNWQLTTFIFEGNPTISSVYGSPFYVDGAEADPENGYEGIYLDTTVICSPDATNVIGHDWAGGFRNVTYQKQIPSEFRKDFLIYGGTLYKIADAIREKEGSTGAIATEDMSARILAIETIALSHLEIVSSPEKIEYTAYEFFNPSGLEVKAIFSNDASKTVTNFTMEPDRALQVTDTNITIKYSEGNNNVEANINILVSAVNVDVPAATNTNFTYSGTTHSLIWDNYNTELVTISGDTSAIDVGTYTVTFTLKDKVNCTWSDGTTEDKSVTWTINKASVTIPTTVNTSFTYNGSVIGPTWENYNDTLIIGENLSATNAGSYTAIFTLKDFSNYQWSDGTTDDKSVTWTINKAQATITLSKSSVTLNADQISDTVTVTSVGMTSITATSSNTGIATVSKSGNVLTIASVNNTSGSATITLSGVVDSNYNAPSYPFIVVEAEFISYIDLVPSADVTYYTGSAVSPTWFNYDSSQLTIGGTTSATDIGTYTATFTPKNGYAWSDGTTTTKSVTWRITDNWPEILQDFTYTENSDGTATLTGWNQTLNGASSTELVVPDNPNIIL